MSESRLSGAAAEAEPPLNAASTGWAQTLGVYLQRDVLIVMLLGFSSGLPLALSGSTLGIWMTESGVNLTTIGLFAVVGTPYTIKFLWAPLVDALDVPVIGRLLGRRRAWLILSQVLLIGAIVFLSRLDPATQTWMIALGALLVATASATQDIVIDAYRVERLEPGQQAAGMGAYVAAYRIGMLASTAGALVIVSYFERSQGLGRGPAWAASYHVMALLVLVGIAATIFAREPVGEASKAREMQLVAQTSPLARVLGAAFGAIADLFSRDLAVTMLAFVVLYKFCDAFAGAMIGPFVIKTGYSRDEYAAIVKGVGLLATLAGGFVGGIVAKRLSLVASLWLGGLLQTVANLSFTLLALSGVNLGMLALAITVENFTSAIGTMIFVAYLSSLCRNPLHTATQFAILSAFSAVGRTYLSAGAGGVAALIGWPMFFVVATLTGLPAFALLWWLQRRGHFEPAPQEAAGGFRTP